MSKYSDVCSRWVNRELHGDTRKVPKNPRMFAVGDRLYSYGRHFCLAEIVRDGKGVPVCFLLNGDRYTVPRMSTPKRRATHV